MSNIATFSDTSKRVIYLGDELNAECVSRIIWGLIDILHEDDIHEEIQKNYVRKPIKLYINSIGGNVHLSWGIVDLIRTSKTEVHTICTGQASSAAFQILISGHKRYAYKHSIMLVHSLSAGLYGNCQQMIEDAEYMKKENKIIFDYISERTKIPKTTLTDIIKNKKDYRIRSDEALKLGCIDEIIE